MATERQSGQVGGATFALVFVAFLWRLGWWWADQVRHTLLLLWRSTDSILIQYVSEITRHVDAAFCHCDFLPPPQKTQLDQYLPILPSERERERWKQYELDAVQTRWLVPNCRKEETDSLTPLCWKLIWFEWIIPLANVTLLDKILVCYCKLLVSVCVCVCVFLRLFLSILLSIHS